MPKASRDRSLGTFAEKYGFTGIWHTTPEHHDSCNRAKREIRAATDSAALPSEDEEPGTDGMIHSRKSVCATADSAEDFHPMIAGARRPRFDAATPPKAVFHAIPDHDGNIANRAVQLIAGRPDFRAKATVIRRSGTGPAKSRAGRVPSLPFLAINPFRQPAIPDGGRSVKV